MGLDISKLENIQQKPDGTIIAACPACRAGGADQKGEHLIIYPNGKFGCVVNQGDSKHRRDIFRLNARAQRRYSVELKPRKITARQELPANFLDLHLKARRHVMNDISILQKIADEFSVRPEVIAYLLGDDDSIGWDQQTQRPVYLYPTGIKLRNNPTYTPRFKWLCGSAERPWRIRKFLDNDLVTRVFLTEGESDALAMIDACMENTSPSSDEIGSVVIAIPGTSFREEWAKLFTDADLVLCMDSDEAGQKATMRISRLCAPYVKSISQINWENLKAK